MGTQVREPNKIDAALAARCATGFLIDQPDDLCILWFLRSKVLIHTGKVVAASVGRDLQGLESCLPDALLGSIKGVRSFNRKSYFGL